MPKANKKPSVSRAVVAVVEPPPPVVTPLPALPSVLEGFRRHPQPVYALEGFTGALVDCIPCRQVSGVGSRDVLVFLVRDGEPATIDLHGTHGTAGVGSLVYVDAPEILAIGNVAKDPARFGLAAGQGLLVRLHKHRGYFVADLATEPTTL